MHYDVLGRLRLRRDAHEVELRRGRPRALLLSLLLARGDVVSTDTLIWRLWRDAPPENPLNALQSLVSYLRRTLLSAGEDVLQTHDVGYALSVGRDALDADRFERAVREGRTLTAVATRPALEEAVVALDEALGLWRGQPFADVAGEDYVRAETTRLEELRASAEEQRIEALLGVGRHDEAVVDLRRLVAADPLRERWYELLMIALYRTGRQAAALQVYQDARSLLSDELGIDPGPGLTRAEGMVLHQDPGLEWREPAGSLPPGPPTAGVTADDAAVPHAVRRQRASLPVDVGPLIGRDDDVRRVRELQQRGRLTTLTGPGGAGKTRVAVEVARRDLDERGSAIWFVDLSTVDADADVAAVTAAALGASVTPDTDPLAGLTGDEVQGLLVLDTCEHVVAGAAAVVSRLLQQCSGLRILATSRRPLEVQGELAWPLPPLALPPISAVTAAEVREVPSVALFMTRAAAVRPAVRLTDENASDVAALCLALDGLPLAIELAAAQADVFSPAALLKRLNLRFDLLSGGARDAVARQRGLRAAVEWSVQLLDDDQRAFFARLSVFPAGFDLSAATAVGGVGEGAGIRLLTSLVRHSLVQSLGRDRYQLLESLRAFAAELVTDEADLRHRHLVHYERVAMAGDEMVRTRGQAEWWTRVRDEMPNIRAALQWSLDGDGDRVLGARLAGWAAWLWTHEGMFAEADRWLTRAAQVESADPATRANVHLHIATYSSPLGDLQRARSAAATALDLATEAGDDGLVGIALIERGIPEWASGDLEQSARTYDEAIAALRRSRSAWGAALAQVLRARTAIDADDPAAAQLVDDAVAAARSTEDQHLLSVALQQTAVLSLRSGDIAAADAASQEAWRRAESTVHQEGMLGALQLRGRVALRRQRLDEAYGFFLECLERAHRISHTAAVCEALESLAETHLERGAPHDAAPLLAVAQAVRGAREVPLRRLDAARVEQLLTRAGGLSDVDRADASPDRIALLVRSLPEALDRD